MKIDNQKNIYRIWLRKLIVTIAFTMSIIAIVFLNILNDPDAPFTKYHLVIVISIVYIIHIGNNWSAQGCKTCSLLIDLSISDNEMGSGSQGG